MKRRLYFLFPDAAHASTTANELETQGIPTHCLHAVQKTTHPDPELPEASEHQHQDFAGRVERIVWDANLAIFALATLLLVALLWQGAYGWASIPLLIMALSFFGGERFTRLPDVHMREFREALQHGEVLLMVDVPRQQVAEVEHQVTRRHPEAFTGGTSWQTDLLAM